MKIGKARRRSTEQKKCSRKALLIGITYQGSEDKSCQLRGPHSDVCGMKDLLIKHYQYEDSNIKILADDGKHDPPTRENILKEMANLVKGVKSDDHRLFHYSGHGGQLDGDPNEEEDGMDEAIIPSDAMGPDDWIKDNVLNEVLVKPLPIGCHLMAVFDMCHSGTALDLDHYDCNAVWVPWIPKGRRRTLSRRYKNVRRCAANDTKPEKEYFDRRGRVLICKRTTLTNVTKKTVSFDVLPATEKHPRQFSLTTRTASIKLGSGPRPPASASRLCPSCLLAQFRRALRDLKAKFNPAAAEPKADPQRTPTFRSFGPLALVPGCTCSARSPHTGAAGRGSRGSAQTEFASGSPADNRWTMSPMQRCTSPENIFGCAGSRLSSPVREKAQVFSLSACNDGQEAYEDAKGVSMTAALVDILSKDPHPTFKSLMTNISHRMWNSAREMHQYYRKRRQERRRRKKEDGGDSATETDTEVETEEDEIESMILQEETVQEPKLGSSRKLKMDEECFSF